MDQLGSRPRFVDRIWSGVRTTASVRKIPRLVEYKDSYDRRCFVRMHSDEANDEVIIAVCFVVQSALLASVQHETRSRD